MLTFLIRSATSQSSGYPIVLKRLGGPHSRPNPHFKINNKNNPYALQPTDALGLSNNYELHFWVEIINNKQIYFVYLYIKDLLIKLFLL